MNVWDIYESRLKPSGLTQREVMFRREERYINSKLPGNLSYKSLLIDGAERNVAVINTDNLNEKFIYSMPGEDIVHGSLVKWMDNFWLVTERDASTELYTRAKMIQCNYLLRWVDTDAVIHEQWCIIEDGTKYLTGVYEDRDFITTRGDSRIAMTISRNADTTKMKRGNRFLIDDEDSELMLAYELTKPLKVGSVYNDQGVFKFVLLEVNTTNDDNQKMRIADYYKYFPHEETGKPSVGTIIDPENKTTDDGRKVWL